MKRRDLFRRLQRKQYKSRNFRNPHSRRNKNRRPLFILLGVLLSLGLILFGLWNYLESDQYIIHSIVVTGTETIPTQDLEQLTNDFLDQHRMIFFSNRKRYFFDSETLREKLTSVYVFESLQIEESGGTLYLKIKEKLSQLIWKSNKKYYLIDLQGVIIREFTKEELNILTSTDVETSNDTLHRLPRFIDLNDSEIQPGKSVLTPEEIDGIFRFYFHLKAQKITVINTKIDRLAGRWMSVSTGSGLNILFDPTQDIKLQAANLETTLRDKIEDPTQLEYIDLRFGDHIYFK